MNNLKKMEKLLAQLSVWVEKNQEGELDLDSIEKATDSAREFYENWVVLKFVKKNEIHDPVTEVIKETFLVSKNTVKKEKADNKELYPVKENLETENDEVSENQTTLIEIIEEIQEDNSINDRIAKGNTKETLADKHAKKPIESLEKSIGINQKFSFIKHLFNGNKTAYSEAIEKLNSCASFLVADDFIQNQLKKTYEWNDETVQVIKFTELVERRYLAH